MNKFLAIAIIVGVAIIGFKLNPFNKEKITKATEGSQKADALTGNNFTLPFQSDIKLILDSFRRGGAPR